MVVLACLVLFSWLASAEVASADDRADEKRACVSASTTGQTDRDEGRLLDARGQFLRCARDSCPDIVRKSCSAWLSALDPRIPSVVVRVVDRDGHHLADAHVTLDGTDMTRDGRAQALDPGPHTVAADAPGMEPAAQSFLLSEGESARAVIVTLAPVAVNEPAIVVPAPPPPVAEAPVTERDTFRVPTGAWVLGGVGVVGLAGFTYFAVSSKKKYDELEQSCAGACTPEQTEPGRRDAVIADVALGVGIGALIGATTWGLLSWRRAHTGSTSIAIAPTARGAIAGVCGRF